MHSIFNHRPFGLSQKRFGQYPIIVLFFLVVHNLWAQPSISISINNATVREQDQEITIIATHTGPAVPGPFTVAFATNDVSAATGSDYTGLSGQLTFNGSSGDFQYIIIPITDDLLLEGDETFELRLLGSSTALVAANQTATISIIDDESDPTLPRAFEQRKSYNLKGDFVMIGNQSLQCLTNCPAIPVKNNGVALSYIDLDTDPSTVNSTAAQLQLPTGATVVWAGLYWSSKFRGNPTKGAINPPLNLSMDQVKLKAPNMPSYQTVTVVERNYLARDFGHRIEYFAVADVTTILANGGNGDYWVADIASTTGTPSGGAFAGWSLVVVYEDLSSTTKNINIWDGFRNIGKGQSANFSITDILTPITGLFNTKLGLFGLDGEKNKTGDYAEINGTAISNALNPADNFFNSTFSENGSYITTRNPAPQFNWGVDVDVISGTGVLANGITAINAAIGTTNEGVFAGTYAISNEVALPQISSSSFAHANRFVGETSTYTFTLQNPANGVNLTNLEIALVLPPGLLLASPTNINAPCGGTIRANAGENVILVTGLNFNAGAACTFSFDITAYQPKAYTTTLRVANLSNNQNVPFEGNSVANIVFKTRDVVSNKRLTYRVGTN